MIKKEKMVYDNSKGCHIYSDDDINSYQKEKFGCDD